MLADRALSRISGPLGFVGLLLGLLVLSPSVGCDDTAPSDGDADADGDGDVELCRGDPDCDDGVFCDGVERCDPGAEEADPRGCLDVAAPVCPEDQLCDEAGDRCLTGCELDPDRDGDGHDSLSCGGDDCDDADANRFPGNPEDCDTLGHDEDCDLSTLGPDADGDGFVFDQCCNTRDDGSLRCGDDCDDGRGGVNPGATEACNRLDDDCDGELDEGTLLTFYRDVDGDGYGVTSEALEDCSAPGGYAVNSGDCDDSLAAVHPGALELCEGLVDEDCDGAIDEDCPCAVDDPPRPCGVEDPEIPGSILTEGACQAGTQRCSVLGDWGACQGYVGPIDEVCNGVDDDCDGELDDGPSMTCVQGQVDEDCDTPCGNPGRRECGVSCRWRDEVCRADLEAVCDYCGDTAAGPADLSGEVALALGEERVELQDHCLGSRFLGEGDCEAGSLIDGSHVDEVGGAYFDAPFLLGYDELLISMRATVQRSPRASLIFPGYGWAIVILRVDGLTDRVGEPSWELAVPYDRNGYSIEWRFYNDNFLLDEADSLELRHIGGGFSSVIDVSPDAEPDLDSGDSYGVSERQWLRVSLFGDISGTVANEMRITVDLYDESSETFSTVMSCAGLDCPLRLMAGVDEVELGLTAAGGVAFSIVDFDDCGGDCGYVRRRGLCR